MKTESKIPGYRIYLSCVAGISVIALVLRTLALFLEMDEIGYFSNGALSVLTVVLQSVTVIGCIVYPFFIKKDSIPSPAPLSVIGKTFALLAALLVAMAAVLLMIAAADTELILLAVVAALALLCGAAYFLLCTKGMNGAYALLAFGLCLGAVLLISLTYFDLFVPMNAPRKTSLHLCLLALMLYMLYDMRDSLSLSKPCARTATAAICFCLSLSMSGSNLIYTLAKGGDLLYTAGDLLSLAIGLFAAVRMTDLLHPRKPAPQQSESEESAQ